MPRSFKIETAQSDKEMMRSGGIAIVLSLAIILGWQNCGSLHSQSWRQSLVQLSKQCSPPSKSTTKLFRTSNTEYENIVNDLIGATISSTWFKGWSPLAPVFGFDTATESRIDAQALSQRLETIERIALAAVASPQVMSKCANPNGSANWDNCARPVLEWFASRAYRRPIKPDELTAIKLVYDQTVNAVTSYGIEATGRVFSGPLPGAVHEGLTASLEAVLGSVSLLYKPEYILESIDNDQRDFALASRLSFYIRSSIADDELWNQAAAQKLTIGRKLQWGEMRLQAERMWNLYRHRFSKNFGGQWLGFRNDLSDEDPLKSSMAQESLFVFDRVLESRLPAEKLLRPGFTFLDERLAAHYGIHGTYPAGHLVSVNSSDRGGILDQAGFLTRTGGGGESHPVQRGIWVLGAVLCRTLPTLDMATLDEINSARGRIDPTLPLSERMALHRNTSGRCFACHSQIDPIGLGLEKYDARGIWRETYANGSAIPPAGPIDGLTIYDPLQLAEVLKNKSEYRNCVSEKLLTFAMNRTPATNEDCLKGVVSSKPSADLREMSITAILLGLLKTSEDLSQEIP